MFYRKHNRLTFDNVDPTTGEILPTMTKQEFKDECDINNIVRQFSQTGMVSHISAKAAQGMYADLPDGVDFQESLAIVEHGRLAFESLPSKIRERFDNDPALFLAFTSNEANLPELRELGLALPEPISAPTAPAGGEGGSPPSEPPKAA